MNPVPLPGEPAGPDSPAASVPPGPSAARPPSLHGALGAPTPGRTRVTRAQADEGGEAVSAENYYATALRRAQLRLSASVAAAFLTVVSVLAIAAASWDLLESTRLAGLPLSWWLIGVALYPLVLGAALLYQAAARRLERRYQRVSGESS